MNCGKHRRPSIRRPTAARQRYEQSRLSEKAETARNGNFRPTIRRPTAKVGSKTATSRQNVAAAPKRSASTGCPAKNGFSRFRHTPATRAGKSRTLSAFSRKNKLLSGKEPTIHAAHSGRIQTIKGLRTQPTAGSVPARRKRLLRKPNLRSPPLPATDSPRSGPDRQPHNCCRSHRSRHFPQAKSSASVPTKENAITASFLEAQRPEFPSEERT